MKKSEFGVLLVFPLIIIAVASAGIFGYGALDSFDKEMEEQVRSVIQLKSNLSNFETNIDTDKAVSVKDKAKEILLLTRETLSAVEGSYNEFGNFSSAISGTVRRHYLAIIIFSLLNIVIVVFIFRLLNKNESL